MSVLPVHFFTIVLNGEPWIRHHLKVLSSLPFEWHWHVVEGVASLTRDTSWSLAHGGQIPASLHDEGRSIDGTSEYLDRIAAEHPDRVTVYRKPRGHFWDGKLDMVGAPMGNLPWKCLLWQLDADELWTADQITRVRELFLAHPEKRVAYFWCHFFVGPNLIATNRGNYGNNPRYEWVRVWRKGPFDRWASHEPPILARGWHRLLRRRRHLLPPPEAAEAFSHDETEAEGLVFQHHAYVLESQLRFKEVYYGYLGAVEAWRALQTLQPASGRLGDYLPWVKDDAMVARASDLGILPLMRP